MLKIYNLSLKRIEIGFRSYCGVIILGGLFLLAGNVSAATYYVDSTGGSNANDGISEITPWQTLGKVNGTTFSPGDNIYFKRGETWSTANGGGSRLSPGQSGSAGGGYITYGAYGTGVDPVIDSTGQTYGLDIQSDKSYLRFQDFKVENASTGQVLLYDDMSNIQFSSMAFSGGVYGIYILSGDQGDISLTDTTISDFSTSGMYVSPASITNLTLTNVSVSSGPVGLVLETDATNLVIAESTFSGLTSHGVSGASSNTITTFDITSSTFNSNGGSGMFLQSGVSDLTVANSYFNLNTSSGLVIQPDTGRTVTVVDISDSEMSSNGVTGLLFGGAGSGTDVTLENITASSNSDGQGLKVTGVWSDIDLGNSDFVSNGSDGLQFFLNSASAAQSEITLDTTTATGNGGSGFQFLGSDGSGSNVNLNNVTASNNSVDGINVKGNWTSIDIDGCTANDNGVDGLSSDGDGITYHNSTTGSITRCFISNNKKSAIAHVGASSLDMSYNIFRHDTNGTIALAYVEGTGTHTFYNNVIYSDAQVGSGLQVNDSTITVTAKNNIIYGFDKGVEKTAGTFVSDYNLVYNAVAGWTGVTQGANSLTSNPIFVDTASLDFSLQSSSPAIDAGTNVGLISDYVSSTVPLGGAQEIGAYEHTPEPSSSRKKSSSRRKSSAEVVETFESDLPDIAIISLEREALIEKINSLRHQLVELLKLKVAELQMRKRDLN